MAWLWLAIAIVFEVIATSALRATAGFTRLLPSLLVVLGYGGAFFFLSRTLDSIPVGIAYAVWSGAGIVLISVIAWAMFGQTLDRPALLGMGLIVAGVLTINLFSTSSAH
ncbi:multidrug/betaine/choline efflux transporter EmrE [Rhodovastum atsumiense]|uniref:QacE family quaternary ammonium compound efflux SMR transporter n=1 Tax=Rhodovastum atsumiense TaxID=504468 RepID=A0A5M6IKR4_9PROT|nr:SMR family transporter [Rhodovastum atsumiense]KAA5608850.1 QacE family quaternary ammonium compound efflux SMR transporter [Rhodovastum atsumiense]CAH2599320.1 multidrug/betaine/choline efflux transporter EmrE [Rhodovastum atsumiense]